MAGSTFAGEEGDAAGPAAAGVRFAVATPGSVGEPLPARRRTRPQGAKRIPAAPAGCVQPCRERSEPWRLASTVAVNTLTELAQDHWRRVALQPLLARYEGQALVAPADWAPVQQALDAARARAPGMGVSFIAFPGTAFATPHHFGFYLHGDTPVSARLREVVLVDARTAEVTAMPDRPWYLTALQLSQPLHFGDYAGLPMKILWTLLDLVTIAVLGSGLYLWLRRRPGRPVAGAASPFLGEA